jgi:hypothetical protein
MENVARKIRPSQNDNFMNTEILTENTLNRLAKALMIRHGIDYPSALAMLDTFQLNLVCNDKVFTSPSHQAALLTAVNTGKRAFHGGVFVDMPMNVPCLLNWPGNLTLNEIVQLLGGTLSPVESGAKGEILYIGKPSKKVNEGYVLYCSGWRGGIASTKIIPQFQKGADFSLGGIAAAAIGVARSFLRISDLNSGSEVEQQGISLWRPDVDWLHPDADGPELEFLPSKLWILGLGHLGQAYLWNFALLPFQNPGNVSFMLQDFDRAVEGNYASGMLCEKNNVGQKKTRICAEWLEQRGFATTIAERPFDTLTKRSPDEPSIACCGFDKAEPRTILENAGFDLIVECALGADAYRFDRLILHTFPGASRTPAEIWKTFNDPKTDPNLVKAFKQRDACGIVAETLAKKAIASSFVGALAGTLVAAEIVRALHGGTRCELVQLHVRHGEIPGVAVNTEDYLLRVGRCGFVQSKRLDSLAA